MGRPPEVTNEPFEAAANMREIQPAFFWPARLRYGFGGDPGLEDPDGLARSDGGCLRPG